MKLFLFLFSLIIPPNLGAAEMCECRLDGPLILPRLSFLEPMYQSGLLPRPYFRLRLEEGFIRPWGQQSSLPCKPPFTATFWKNGKSLTFFAASHLQDMPSQAASQTAALQAVIEQTQPSGLVIEVEPTGELEAMTQNCRLDSKPPCSESAWAIRLSRKLGTRVIGAEPSSFALKQEMSAAMPLTDFENLEFAQAIITFRREGLAPSAWPERFEVYRQSYPSDSFKQRSYAQFADAVVELAKQPLASLDSRSIAPLEGAAATGLQKIAHAVDQMRERLILRTSEKVLNDYDRTLIVYGAAHYYKDALAYEHALGAPQIRCLSAP